MRSPAVWLVLSGLVVVVGILKAPQFPTNDPALFEYYGRHLLRGARLYVDLWDNKLPSIYLVNEFWQWLFGDRYRLHVVVEAVVNVLSIALFAALLRRHKLQNWSWATFCFAVALMLLPAAYDYTEFYAVPLILGAFLAIDLPFLAGACIALAATFWIPSLLLTIVFCLQRRRLWPIVSFAGGVLAVAIPYAAAFVFIMGAHTVTALAATWPVYIRQGGTSLTTSRLGFLRSLYAPMIISGAGACLAAFLVFVRRPNSDAQRLAIGWICASLIGTLLTGHPSFHYFIPSLAALIFGIAAFAEYPFKERPVLPRMVAALAALLLLSGTVESVFVQNRDVAEVARSAQAIGTCIYRELGSNTVIYAAEYAPELYLAADAVPGNLFAVIDPVLSMTQKMSANMHAPKVIIAIAEDAPPPLYQLRYIAEPWRVYTEGRIPLTCPKRFAPIK
jgi:hypothetical protein